MFTIPDGIEVDPRAMFVARQLMEANKLCFNRQCAAATASALFHLAMGQKASDGQDRAHECQQANGTLPPSVTTAQLLQTSISKHADNNFPTLAKAMKEYRSHMPSPLAKEVDKVNRIASYDRHHVVPDKALIERATQFLDDNSPFATTAELQGVWTPLEPGLGAQPLGMRHFRDPGTGEEMLWDRLDEEQELARKQIASSAVAPGDKRSEAVSEFMTKFEKARR